MHTMTREEIDELLREVGYGFLGLADGGQPYVIPMSFGYDGEHLFFQMNSRGRKYEYIEHGTAASFTAVNLAGTTSNSASVIVEGVLERVPEAHSTHAMQIFAENGGFGTDFDIWDTPLQEIDFREFRLVPYRLSGRAFS